MNKLRAFTIMEMMIVLLLSTVVIGIAYLSYTIISREYGSYARETSEVSGIMLLDRALTIDIHRGESVRVSEDGFNCIRGDTVINYRLTDSLLIRSWNELAADTFRLDIDSLVLHFEGKEQPLKEGLIDQVKLCLRHNDLSFELLKHKWYSAASLLENSYGRN